MLEGFTAGAIALLALLFLFWERSPVMGLSLLLLPFVAAVFVVRFTQAMRRAKLVGGWVQRFEIAMGYVCVAGLLATAWLFIALFVSTLVYISENGTLFA